MLVHWRVILNINSSGTHLYTSVERATVRVKCLDQEHNISPRPRLEPGPLDPETSALTMRPHGGFRKLKVSGPFDAIWPSRNLCFESNSSLSLKSFKDSLKFYTRFQCYVHRRHLGSPFDMPSFDMLCNGCL